MEIEKVRENIKLGNMDYDTVTRNGKWNPTREQLEAYRVREVEMCRANIRVLQQQNHHPKQPITQQETLHSWVTFVKADGLL